MDANEARRLLDADATAELLSKITPEEMAHAWCRYANRNVKNEGEIDWESDEDGWAAELYYEVVFLDNEPFLRAFLATLADAAPDEVLGWVGAGPLEDFVTGEDPDRLCWIEAQAARSERFRRALANIWVRSSASDETVQRLERAAGVTLG
jgi:hypothetical protein